VEEMGVDGFRFDLASIFERNNNGALDTINPPIIEEIGMDPVLSQVRLIAEPWDITAYQLGCGFPGEGWSQWNDRYRDDIRRFLRGDEGMVSALITRLYGSNDIFPDVFPNNCRPYQSINFITAHDGFCLYDLVAYNDKHNEANGYNNTDGTNANYSWNCGAEGDEGVTNEVIQMRKQQARNFAAVLMLSNGIPMLKMGDEFLHTQLGNNNPFNQDNKINWLNWSRLKENDDVFQFFKKVIEFRRTHPSISSQNYWDADVRWFGTGPEVDYSAYSRSLAFYLSGEASDCADIYVMINAWWEPLEFTVQVGQPDEWQIAICTANGLVEDGLTYTLTGRSILVLEKKNQTGQQ
jgi:glycogen operon protein